MNTKAVPRGEARELIIKSAFKVYGAYGFHGASTREIARQAGVSQGLVTYHFKTKRELWCAAVDYTFGLLKKALYENDDALKIEDPQEAKREELRQFVRFAAKHPELHHFMMKVKDDDDGRLKWLTETHLEFAYASFAEAFTDIPKHFIPHIFYGAVGASSLIFAVGSECKLLTGLDPHNEEVIEAHAEFIVRLFMP